VDLNRRLDAAVDHAGEEASRRLAADPTPKDDRDVVGPAQRELVADRLLEPGPAGLGAVEDPGVGQFELAEGELVAVAQPAVGRGERRGQPGLPATEEALHVARRQAARDRGQRLGVVGRAEAVVERLEADAGLLRLALGPLVAVEADPDGKRRVGHRLDERRPPVPVAQVEVVVIDEHRLAAEGEVRVAVRPAVTPAAPGRGLLLGDADHHDPEAPLALGPLEVGARQILLRGALPKTQQWDLVVFREALDLLHVTAPDLAEQRRRGNRVAAIEQKAHHLPLAHQPRHIPLQEQAVDRAHPQRHVVAQ